jgi:salicylate hydroxylase
MALGASANPWQNHIMDDRNFSIVGGGIAGLACALGVADWADQVQVFEKAAGFEHVGAGVQLGPNAARALQKLGAWDAVRPCTHAPPEIHIRNGKTGRILSRIKLGKGFEKKYGAPYRVAHRADLHSALLSVVQANRRIDLDMGVEVAAADLVARGPVLAADGIWSKTRQALFPQSRVVVLKDKIFRSLNPMPAGAGQVALDCVNLWLFPGGHVVHYPVSDPQKLNLVAMTQGLNPVDHFKAAAFDLQLLLTGVESWLEWPAAHLDGLEGWSSRGILLVGDAAHGTVPYLAQGAAMALEDAACLHDLVMSGSDAGRLFENYSAARLARCQRLGAESLKAGRIYHLAGPLSLARDMVLAVTPGDLLMHRQAWIYDGGK